LKSITWGMLFHRCGLLPLVNIANERGEAPEKIRCCHSVLLGKIESRFYSYGDDFTVLFKAVHEYINIALNYNNLILNKLQKL
jgi:hypothetical protein